MAIERVAERGRLSTPDRSRYSLAFLRLRRFCASLPPLLFGLIPAYLILAPYVFSQTPKLSQMVHRSWTARDGAPQAIRTLSQAPDGALWIGSDGGLFRFDGISFQEFQPAPGEPRLPSNGILSVCALPDGTVWVGMYLGGAARIANGHVTLYARADDQPLSIVDHVQAAPDGSVWASNNRASLVRFAEDGRWHQQQTPLGPGGGLIYGFFFDRSGTLWVPQGGHLYRRPSGAPTYTVTSGEVDFMVGSAEAPDGSVWIADVNLKTEQGRLQHLDRMGNLVASLSPTDEAYSILYAKDGSLWMATQSAGVLRLGDDELRKPGSSRPDGSPRATPHASEDRYTHLDGLSANSLTGILSDSDGNIWMGSNLGLDRFSAAILKPFSLGKPDAGWSVCSDSTGSLWIGSDLNTLHKISGQTTRSFANVGAIAAISCGKAGDVWFMDPRGVWAVHDDGFKRLPPVPGASPFAVRQVTETSDHTLFIAGGTGLHSLWTYKDGAWAAVTGLPPLDQAPGTVFVDSLDRLWTGYKDGRIGLPLPGKVLSSGTPGLGVVYAFLETSQGILAAGMNGVARLHGDGFQMLTFADQLSTRGLTGMVQSPNGDLWLNGSRGIVRVPFQELAGSLVNPAYPIKSEVFNEGDFTGPSRLTTAGSSATRDAEGKLWFSMLTGLVTIDPEHLHLRAHVPSLSIRSVTADQLPLGPNARVAPKPQTLLIRYLGVNLTAPERVIYRYKLEGLDEAWQDVGHRTEAIYTHLRPGKYTFRVMASNGSEGWTAPVSSASFVVLPSFYQTWWFLSLCGLVALLLLWLIVTIRVRSVASAIKVRYEERADERVRIARDLHDTLLQGVQGLLLTFHVATQKVSRDDDSRILLERALTMADKIIIEGRDRVNRLRAEHLTDAELIEHIERIGADLTLNREVQFRVQRSGIAAELQPYVVDELFYIAREALTNSFRHSQASEIEVFLDYQRRWFVLCCKDNGCGFEEEQGRKATRQGHWGLHGMAERAKKVGGRFSCQSSSTAGTQISVSVPCSHAYVQQNWLKSFASKIVFRKAV